MEKIMKKIISAISSLALLSGCASILSGTEQEINLVTPQYEDAKCRISNDQGEWLVDSTPTTIKVKRSKQQLLATCEKDDLIGETAVLSTFNNRVIGNVLLGGLIGLAVDYGTDAAYEYPDVVSVDLLKKSS
jgi:uncharacterized protein YceK